MVFFLFLALSVVFYLKIYFQCHFCPLFCIQNDFDSNFTRHRSQESSSTQFNQSNICIACIWRTFGAVFLVQFLLLLIVVVVSYNELFLLVNERSLTLDYVFYILSLSLSIMWKIETEERRYFFYKHSQKSMLNESKLASNLFTHYDDVDESFFLRTMNLYSIGFFLDWILLFARPIRINEWTTNIEYQITRNSSSNTIVRYIFDLSLQFFI